MRKNEGIGREKEGESGVQKKTLLTCPLPSSSCRGEAVMGQFPRPCPLILTCSLPPPHIPRRGSDRSVPAAASRWGRLCVPVLHPSAGRAGLHGGLLQVRGQGRGEEGESKGCTPLCASSPAPVSWASGAPWRAASSEGAGQGRGEEGESKGCTPL